MPKIIIGRSSDNSLQVTIDGKQQALMPPVAVPPTVSSKHCSLTTEDFKQFELRNLTPENHTFAKGVAVTKTTVKMGDIVELGDINPAKRYRLDWRLLEKALPRSIDIRPLKAVWDSYRDRRKAIQLEQQRFNNKRGLLVVFTIGGSLLGTVLGMMSNASMAVRIIPMIAMMAAVAFAIYMYQKGNKMAIRNMEMQERLDEQFRHEYICPECKKFLGNKPYDLLQQDTSCPYCHTPYKTYKS